jgi:hypothetical protein
MASLDDVFGGVFFYGGKVLQMPEGKMLTVEVVFGWGIDFSVTMGW